MPEKAGEFDEVSIVVELWSSDEQSVLKVEERLKVQGTLSELSGILHQVHELAERIRDGQAGLKT